MQEGERIHGSFKGKCSTGVGKVVFCGLGVAGLVASFIAITCFSGPSTNGSLASFSATQNPPVFASHKLSLMQYIQLGRWRADALTLVAEARYLLASEYDVPKTNHDVVISTVEGSIPASSTNSAWGIPTA